MKAILPCRDCQRTDLATQADFHSRAGAPYEKQVTPSWTG